MRDVLIFFAHRRAPAFAYYEDWFDALRTHPGWKVHVVDTSTRASLVRGLLRARRRAWDLVLYPYSFFYANTDHWRRAILTVGGAKLRGTKVFFLENEYRMLRDKLACAVAVGADYVTTQLPKDVADRVYGGFFEPARIIPLPHGLARVDEAVPAADDPRRDIDLAFRGASFPYYVGHRDRELMLEFFTEHAGRLDLRVDLEVERYLAPAEWRRFLHRTKGVLGHESGSGFLEVNDATRRRVLEYEANPGVTFDEIFRLFFKDYPDPVSGRVVSSRHFEAIGANCAQVLFPGRYNDILRAGEHYLPLARDFSNVDDVLRRFRDVALRRRMVEDTAAYVRDAHTLRHRIAGLARWVAL